MRTVATRCGLSLGSLSLTVAVMRPTSRIFLAQAGIGARSCAPHSYVCGSGACLMPTAFQSRNMRTVTPFSTTSPSRPLWPIHTRSQGE